MDLNGTLVMSATGAIGGTLISVDPDDHYPNNGYLYGAGLKSAGQI